MLFKYSPSLSLAFENAQCTKHKAFALQGVSKYRLMGERFMGGVHPPLRTFLISDLVLQETKKIF